MRARILLMGILLVSCSSAPTSSPQQPVSSSPSTSTTSTPPPAETPFQEFHVPAGSHPHDVAPASDGRVWFTEQDAGAVGVLDPKTGDVKEVKLGRGSRPHGIIVGIDGALWVTDQGLNAIVRIDPKTYAFHAYKISTPKVQPHTPVFDRSGLLWFTGNAGYYGSVDIETGEMTLHPAPRGSGPYGITTTPDGAVWFANLGRSYIARINPEAGNATVFDVPTKDGGARRLWSDSRGVLWVAEWYSGKLARFDPRTKAWKEWKLPGVKPQPYAVFVDPHDIVWLTDFGSNALVRFDPKTQKFDPLTFPSETAEVRQLNGRTGEIWGAESGTDKLVEYRT